MAHRQMGARRPTGRRDRIDVRPPRVPAPMHLRREVPGESLHFGYRDHTGAVFHFEVRQCPSSAVVIEMLSELLETKVAVAA